MTTLTATESNPPDPIIGLQAITEVPTIADLRALDGPSSQIAVNVLGYYSAGDGGGGQFYWDSTSSATHNGGTVIAPTAGGTGRWKWVDPTNIINVKRFGAVGDGITNDQTVIILARNAAQGGALFFPAGTYLITGSISMLSNTRWIGDGCGNTT